MDARDEDVQASQDQALDVQGPPSGLTTRPAPLRPHDPRLLGEYRILGRLGEGGMGAVFLGRGRDTGLVAIKVIRTEITRIPRYRERFCREAAAASQVANRCTAAVLDVARDASGALYLVSEFVDGPTLAQAVAARGPLGAVEVERIAIGVAAALSAMHSAGLVHRDLSPANVLLSPLGPRVIDFGLARVSDDAPRGPRGRIAGTPAFMSPEQASGHRVRSATDIFAWGALVVFAATGEPPFGNGTAAQQMRRLQCDDPDFDRVDTALGAAALATIVRVAMRRESAARPSADDLLRHLVRSEDALAAVGPAPATASSAATASHSAPDAVAGLVSVIEMPVVCRTTPVTPTTLPDVSSVLVAAPRRGGDEEVPAPPIATSDASDASDASEASDASNRSGATEANLAPAGMPAPRVPTVTAAHHRGPLGAPHQLGRCPAGPGGGPAGRGPFTFVARLAAQARRGADGRAVTFDHRVVFLPRSRLVRATRSVQGADAPQPGPPAPGAGSTMPSPVATGPLSSPALDGVVPAPRPTRAREWNGPPTAVLLEPLIDPRRAERSERSERSERGSGRAGRTWRLPVIVALAMLAAAVIAVLIVVLAHLRPHSGADRATATAMGPGSVPSGQHGPGGPASTVASTAPTAPAPSRADGRTATPAATTGLDRQVAATPTHAEHATPTPSASPTLGTRSAPSTDQRTSDDRTQTAGGPGTATGPGTSTGSGTTGGTSPATGGSGTGAVMVADVRGRDVASAESTLRAAGLGTARRIARTDQVLPGTVLDQSPSAGLVAPGTVVTLLVAAAPG
ncbi:serine/threonine protein kinase [Frankia sp. AgPm24]|uniref:serine/threonine protein kinase n=1 Tax=Frankia sp. AgPm24 TaxID=631128 RepID=UPI00200E4037|nr:serine/threonine protein kinase [Frankia sp. AgPm24]MCK9923444.1 serine/threonine protein kinase [Frankia sp. AgPm24]